jgi:hypothetical protein
MIFVDGENFTIRGQNAVQGQIALAEGRFYKRNCFVWYPDWSAKGWLGRDPTTHPESLALRSYYYASAVGDDLALNDIARKLWNLGFSPQVFKRSADQGKSKGVDIALCKDMLSHAFQDHYDLAVLVAGDGDYVPLVEQVKRLGKLVHVWFFMKEGLNPSLELAADSFCDLTNSFIATWIEATNAGRAV